MRTGVPQNEAKQRGDSSAAGSIPIRTVLRVSFAPCLGSCRRWREPSPVVPMLETVRTVVDIDTAQGYLPVELALAHPHLSGGGFDLPDVALIFKLPCGIARAVGQITFHTGRLLCGMTRREVVTSR